MTAREIMTTPVISVGLDTPVATIARLLIKHRISAVFVTDSKGGLRGVVSEGDLMRRSELGTNRPRPWWLALFRTGGGLADEYAKAYGRTAKDVMTDKLVTIKEDATLPEIAGLLERHGIKRVPVVQRGKPVGIVSRANLIRALAATKPTALGVRKSDREIRVRLIAELQDQPWAAMWSPRHIVVTQGIVQLWGEIASEQERKATRALAERIPGVHKVEDHLKISQELVWLTQ